MITDMLSHSFSSEPDWHWETHHEFYTHFNSMIPLSLEHSWAMFVLSYNLFMKVVCVLQMQASTLNEWR
jgi:hypothetical protein